MPSGQLPDVGDEWAENDDALDDMADEASEPNMLLRVAMGVGTSSKSARNTPSSSLKDEWEPWPTSRRRRASSSSRLNIRTYSTASTSLSPRWASVESCSFSRP